MVIPFYTDPVANLTLVIEDELLKEARKLAIDQNTSVKPDGAGVSGIKGEPVVQKGTGKTAPVIDPLELRDATVQP